MKIQKQCQSKPRPASQHLPPAGSFKCRAGVTLILLPQKSVKNNTGFFTVVGEEMNPRRNLDLEYWKAMTFFPMELSVYDLEIFRG